MTEDVVVAQPQERGWSDRSSTTPAHSMRSVFGNTNLRRMQLAFAGSLVGNWAYATAVAVWAYGVGGAKAVGIYTAVRLGLMAVTSPFAATLADRYSRKLVMIGCGHLLRSARHRCGCLSLPRDTRLAGLRAGDPDVPRRLTVPRGAGSPDALAGEDPGGADGVQRHRQHTREPRHLRRAGDRRHHAGVRLGPDGVPVQQPVVRVVHAHGVRHQGRPGRAPSQASGVGAGRRRGSQDAPQEGFLAETSAGFRTIWRDKDLLVSVVEGSAQTVVAGATAVFPLVMAVEILQVGPKGVGWLDSASGIAAVVGGIWAISRASKHKLAQDMTLGVVLWSLPLLLVTIWPSPIAAFAAMAVLGFANPLVDVNLFTIVQRLTPDEVLGRVFGALEACLIATMAIGAALTPLLLHWFGLRATLAILGLGHQRCRGGRAPAHAPPRSSARGARGVVPVDGDTDVRAAQPGGRRGSRARPGPGGRAFRRGRHARGRPVRQVLRDRVRGRSR